MLLEFLVLGHFTIVTSESAAMSGQLFQRYLNYRIFSNLICTSFCWFLKWKKVSSRF